MKKKIQFEKSNADKISIIAKLVYIFWIVTVVSVYIITLGSYKILDVTSRMGFTSFTIVIERIQAFFTASYLN